MHAHVPSGAVNCKRDTYLWPRQSHPSNFTKSHLNHRGLPITVGHDCKMYRPDARTNVTAHEGRCSVSGSSSSTVSLLQYYNTTSRYLAVYNLLV